MMMNQSETDKIYDILVKHAGAPESPMQRMSFHRFMNVPGNEFRFGGKLGFGGKFWKKDSQRDYRVSCYQEDEKNFPEMEEVAKKTNEELSKI